MKVYTIRDIAQMAGVSVTTVSRVLNNRPDVSRDTQEKVRRVMQEHHFVGNANARGLKQAESDLVAVIIRGRRNPFLNELAEAMLQFGRESRAAFVTEYIDERADEFRHALTLIGERRITGIIFVGSRIDERCKALDDIGIPMVFATVSTEGTGMARASSVSIDDRLMGRLVGESLLKLGHVKTAVFGSNPVAGDSLAMRYQGLCEAYAERGLEHDRTLYRESRFSFEAGYETAKVFFTEHPEVTALFTMSDTVAVGAIRALNDLGISVPGDVSVVGFDGVEVSRYTVPRLSTVEQPVEEIARRSVNLLLDMMEKGAAPRHILVEAAFRKRESLAENRRG